MSPSCGPQPTRALTAADAVNAVNAVNEEIRAFMRARCGRSLLADEAAEYARLLEARRRGGVELAYSGELRVTPWPGCRVR
jgi:hypothetical protein